MLRILLRRWQIVNVGYWWSAVRGKSRPSEINLYFFHYQCHAYLPGIESRCPKLEAGG
jgi:hypothetical protein